MFLQGRCCSSGRAPAAAEVREVAERALELHLAADRQRLHKLAQLAALRETRVLVLPVHLPRRAHPCSSVFAWSPPNTS